MADMDRYYTHSTRVDYAFRPGAEPDWLRWMMDHCYATPRNSAGRAAGLFVAQHVYTASDIDIAEPSPTDRPYGGWLFGGVALMGARNQYQADQVAISLGVVGSLAQGDRIQELFHHLIGSGESTAWRHQLHNELALDILVERVYRPFGTPPAGPGWDILPHFGVNVGNVFLQARVGFAARAGINLPDDFGPASGRPLFSTARSAGLPRAPRFRAFAFASVEARGVVHNLFLDGNTLRDSPAVSRTPVVEDFALGASVYYADRWSLSYSQVWRTKEFKTQEFAQAFGSLSVAFRF